MTDKLWGGRFTEKAAHWVDAFGASIGFDQQMAKEDLEGSLAHVKMLGKTGIIPQTDADKITAGLHHLKKELAAGKLHFTVENEDIHLNMELCSQPKSARLPASCTRHVHAMTRLPPICTSGSSIACRKSKKP